MPAEQQTRFCWRSYKTVRRCSGDNRNRPDHMAHGSFRRDALDARRIHERRLFQRDDAKEIRVVRLKARRRLKSYRRMRYARR